MLTRRYPVSLTPKSGHSLLIMSGGEGVATGRTLDQGVYAAPVELVYLGLVVPWGLLR